MSTTVMQRLVANASSYAARRLNMEFGDSIGPRGPSLPWEKGKRDWYFVQFPVQYPLPKDRLESDYLERALAGLILDLKGALEQNPDEKLTFYGLSQDAYSRFPRMFNDRDFRAECVAGNVVVSACGTYKAGTRVLTLNAHVTPMYKRPSDELIIPFPNLRPATPEEIEAQRQGIGNYTPGERQACPVETP